MLAPLLRFSIRHRMLIVFVSLLVAIVGGWSLVKLPIDAVPDITNVQVQINTEASALTPEDVERQVTWPIETSMAGIPGLDATRSLSRNGFSQVTVSFKDGTDIYFARQQVAERLAQTREDLPSGAEPQMGAISTGLGEVLMYTVSFVHPSGGDAAPAPEASGWRSEGYLTPEGQLLRTAEEQASYLRTVQDWIVAPQLKTVPGVAGVDSIGGYEKHYQVSPDPFKLVAYDVTVSDLIEALHSNNRSVGAGFIERHGESFVVRTSGRVETIADIGAIVIAVRDSTPIRVSDVAEVGIGKELRTGSASRNGAESVVGTVMMLMGENSRTVARAASERLAHIGRSLPPDVMVEEVLNRQTLVDATIATVEKNLSEGAALVIAVLFLMLGNLRGALIAALVIPLSMCVAAIGMVRFGISGNLMSLGAIDFGIIVDAAIIIVENCLRALAQQQHRLGRLPTLAERLHVTYAAAKDMVQPVLFGQAIIITVFVPVLLLSGIEGKMFQPMGATVIFALVGSLLFSLTLVPALVALSIRGKVRESDSWLMRKAQGAYLPLLAWSVRSRLGVIASAVVLMIVACWGFTRLGSEFVPTLDEGNLAMHAMRIPSVGISQSTLMQLEVEKAVKEAPEVAVVFSKTGTAEMASDPMPPNVSDTFIMLKPPSAWPDQRLSKEEVADQIAERLASVPGNNYEFTQPIQMRFNELISGVRSDVAVKVFGDRFEDMLPAAERIAAALRLVPGARAVKVEQVEGLPTLSVNLRHAEISRLGLTISEVQEAVAMAVGGQEAGVLFEGDRRFDIVVRLAEPLRSDIAALEQLPIPLPHGEDEVEQKRSRLPMPAYVPLGAVADLVFAEGTNQISRDNGKRRIVVQANVSGRDLGSFVDEARNQVDLEVKLPAGSWLVWGGQYENLKEARDRLLVVVPACLLMIVFLLFSAFDSFKHALLVFTGVPLALTGGVAALWICGMPFSMSAAVGFIALSGVAVLNGLVVVSHINHLRKEGFALDDAISTACATKLRAVIMTALVGALGYVPMAIATGKGAEVQKPLAIVVIGGIISSTALTLIVLPGLYRLWHRKDERWRTTDLDEEPAKTG